MNEFELIERIFSQMQAAQSLSSSVDKGSVEKGIGDDAAVMALPAGSRLVSCIDTLVQGRHFSADWEQVNKLAFAIGYKAVAVNVSDIAAMGATPHSILLALALPKRLVNEQWLGEFAKGLFHACKLFGVTLIGGDTTRNDSLVLSVSAQGLLDADTPAVYRSGAQVGDKIYVSGSLGDAAYALQHPDNEQGAELAHRLHMPTPRITLGAALAKIGVSSMIDISDGLYQDLGHICQQSRVGMRINLEQLPTSRPLASVDLTERLLCQLAGGDDYELAFTLPANIEPPTSNTPVTCIGEVTASTNTVTKDSNANIRPELYYQGQPVTPTHPAPFSTWPNLTGYQHFAG
ncbi:thiamine-phosphate kinase [Psychrobacter sp. AOP22-C1-22]|uniref:thiamine-phosphate kinase n=1 Tax=unclassified Psychrobacter TaxID=196806 RepID=UPI001787E4E8|nr:MULTISPECIES: thiamine-phosphate kinase [unclassified Psychrobacter]MDN5800920.1 thiamine-phosphate kinase [Psychrobacter sp.]MBE0406600.1 thiamine-phosphate kinase [Psychrobacter sp. FME6]MBE0443987.1 thiamine-phosphate kinase [Psychrobacter sp. FME5]MDN5890935.1 thiamine-phosphate kinase [Psychrobacter sp.]MDN5897208.1 thiamine-phosphate kinase [Psychrobacter sp.]